LVLGVVHASHAGNEIGLSRVQVGHDHSVGAERGLGRGSSSAVKSIISDFVIGIGLGIILVDDVGLGLGIGLAEVDGLGGRDGAIPSGIVLEVEEEAILLGPALSS
jgi:hypothetical protein